MTYKEYLAVKNYLAKAEKQIREEAEKEYVSPLEVEKHMPEFMKRVLEFHGIDAEEYFKIDAKMDKTGGERNKLLESEIDIESLEEEEQEGWVKKLVKDIVAQIRGKK